MLNQVSAKSVGMENIVQSMILLSCESCPEGQTTYSFTSTSADECFGKKTIVLNILR